MNVYEEAHNLARAIRESNEYKDFDEKRKAIESDAETNNMVKELQAMQVQIQAKQMTGQQPDQNEMQRMQSLYAMVMTRPKAAEYIQAQLRFGVMMKDVLEILSDFLNFTM